MVVAYILGGVVVLAAIGGGTVFYLYRKKKQEEEAYRRVQELSRDIQYMMDEREMRHPKLLEHKLNAVDKELRNGNYQDAERILEDLFRLVQLS